MQCGSDATFQSSAKPAPDGAWVDLRCVGEGAVFVSGEHSVDGNAGKGPTSTPASLLNESIVPIQAAADTLNCAPGGQCDLDEQRLPTSTFEIGAKSMGDVDSVLKEVVTPMEQLLVVGSTLHVPMASLAKSDASNHGGDSSDCANHRCVQTSADVSGLGGSKAKTTPGSMTFVIKPSM